MLKEKKAGRKTSLLLFLEAAIGVEPMNKGFADLCLSHLATPPFSILNAAQF